VGTVARRFGTFFHRRGSFRCAARTKDRLSRTLRGGEPVAFFPEGTTTRGTALSRFYPALFQAAVDSGAAVRPVSIRYRDANGRPTSAPAYVGDMSILESVGNLLTQRSIVAELTFGAPIDARSADRRELARRARSWIEQQLFTTAHQRTRSIS
jgi:1-acyl-sn-glycerol-3-phosphate acyltransferase